MTDTSADLYKDTVFLPKTEFPMRGDLPQKEPGILATWQSQDLYKKMRAVAHGRPRYVLHDGPPYANGDIHMGHALNKILKDVIVRTRQGAGFDSPYIPGWDCHGLPIEWKIEEGYRAAGKNKDDVDILTFRKQCRDFAQKWVDIQAAQFQRLGVSGDWANPYLTMTNHGESRIVGEIHKFLMNGLLYKGVKPVMWSVVEKTALAEAEVEYKEHKSLTVWVKFPIVTDNAEFKDASIVIWTTTPWTMPSNRAIAVGPDIAYAVYQVAEMSEGSKSKVGDKIVIANKLVADVEKNAHITLTKVSKDYSGKEFFEAIRGKNKYPVCKHPLHAAHDGYKFDVKVLEGSYVTDDSGTGFVHIAPAHGEEDFNLYFQHFGAADIPDNVSDDGLFRDHVPMFAGLAIYNQKGEMDQGNFAPIKAIDEADNLLAKGSIRHEYPHSWRSKAPVIFRTTPQWFIAMDKMYEPRVIAGGNNNRTLRETALQAIRDTDWYPAAGENRITAMIEQRPDWCISRQRAWGVPIALFLDKKTGEPLRDHAVNQRIQDVFETEGSDAWFARPAQDFLGTDYKADDYVQVRDIVDVWFESGSTHGFVMEDRTDGVWPADLYLEGSDQHRGWFHSSLLESCGTRGRAPYKGVLTHGFVLDEKGYKMSKSLGNIVDPLQVMKESGGDILRLWAITSDYAEDIRIGKDTLKSVGDLYRRIRNTFRFLLGALDGFTPAEKIAADAYKDMPELERFVLHSLAELDGDIRAAIDAHDYNRMAQRLHLFCSAELSAFYFDIRKDRLYCDRPDGFERRATRTVLYHLYECLVTWFAPILCFTAEEAWSHRPAGLWSDVGSVHLMSFADIPAAWRDNTLAAKWEAVRNVRRVVLGALEPKRADKTIGSSLEAHPHIYVDANLAEALEGVNMAEVAITSQATLTIGAAPAGAYTLPDVAGVAVVFAKAEGKKCDRCWKILPDVGSDKDYPNLSARDADAVRYYLSQRKAA